MLTSKQYFEELESVFLFPEDCLSNDGFDLLYEMFNELELKEPEEQSKFITGFIYELKQNRIKNNKCPKCNQSLKIITKQDNEPLEYFGTPCNQSYTYKRCPECGWRDDK